MTVKVRKWNGSWFVVAHYGGQRKTKKCKNQDEAERLARRIEAQLEVLGPEAFRKFGRRGSSLPTFSKYATKWLREARTTDRKETTLKLYTGAIRNHLGPCLGKITLDEVSYPILKALCIELQPSLSRESIRGIIGVARLIMKEAEREGLIANNPVKDLGRYFGKQKAVRPPDPFSVGELADIIKNASHWDHYKEFIILSAKTGLRFGDVII